MNQINKEWHFLSGEAVIYRGHRHWMVFLFPLFWFASGILFFFDVVLGKGLALFPLLVGVVMVISSYIDYFMTEITLTNKRIVRNMGFFNRESIALPLHNIARVELKQSLWGRILRYGSVELSDVGGKQLTFQRISAPLKFKNALLRAKDEVASMAKEEKK